MYAGTVEAAPSSEEVVYRDVIAIGASAGGLEPLMDLVRGLPEELPAAVLVVLHVLPTGRSLLAEILGRRGHLPSAPARDGEPVEPGRVYVAQPDRHLLLEDGAIRLTSDPRENGHRPAVDPLFRSVAREVGPRGIGVVLSGSQDDGAAGLRQLKLHGGTAVAQDPDDALYPSMPHNACAATEMDRVVPAPDLARTLSELIQTPVESSLGDTPPAVEEDTAAGMLTDLKCPDCGGPLWERQEGPLLRFACRVGHAFGSDSLAGSQAEALEGTLWAALNTLEERADLLRRTSRSAAPQQRAKKEAEATALGENAEAMRQTILHLQSED